MPFYFGFQPRSERPAATTVTIAGVTYEPTEPSKVKVFPQISVVSVLGSLWRHLLALLVVVCSYGKGTYLPITSEGEDPDVPTTPLPIPFVGFAFTLKKGVVFDQTVESELKDHGFSTIKYNRQTVYFKKPATKEDYQWVDENIPGINATCNVPNQFLNPQAFFSLIYLRNITSVICGALHQACIGDEDYFKGEGEDILEASEADLVTPDEARNGKSAMQEPNLESLKALDEDSEKNGQSPWMKFLQSVFLISSSSKLNVYTPGIVVNPFSKVKESFISSGDSSAITTHGIICKFHPALAKPDPNLVTDVLGQYFLKALGSSQTEQFDTFKILKSGIAQLRLTRIGDEYAHLYRCIQLAIECQCGMVPFFSGSMYEGSILMGGEGALLITPSLEAPVGFLKQKDLIAEYQTVSTHGTALSDIANRFPAESRPAVTNVKSLVTLRGLCLTGKFSKDDMEYITGRAADLMFESNESWVVNPANIKKSMMIISGSLPITPDIPITRHCLFSKDPVLLGLSVFGEKTAPSWNIPQGTLCSLSASPPVPPTASNIKGSSTGIISDSKWVMEVRKTDLGNAVDDFRVLAGQGGYRSVSSSIARKQGFFVFGRERMVEFWAEMQLAYRSVDSRFKIEAGEATISKGKRQMERELGEGSSISKKKRI
jgi:hypothetical protein